MSTSRDYASDDPRSFARWLREGERCAPEKPLTHPDYAPKADAIEDVCLKKHDVRGYLRTEVNTSKYFSSLGPWQR